MELEGFCRGCLIRYDELTDLMQYTEKNRRLYVYSTGLQVKRNDIFTFQLCKDCYVNMKLSCKFKKQCRATDKKFRQYLALKETGTSVDFCSYLKTHDDAYGFRLPFDGSSTPIYQKSRDEDNESTCTSIRNFMTDILAPDEIADTEARIIREVIEEEADVLDDSLDSQWLQDDDMSVDGDYRLDFSFSPFSTPKATSEERCETPQKLRKELDAKSITNNSYKKHDIIIDLINETDQKDVKYVVNQIQIPDVGFSEINNQEATHGFSEINNQEKPDGVDTTNIIENDVKFRGKFYVENESIYDDIGIESQQDQTIEKNLEEALKEDKTEYTLEELLNTPRPKEELKEDKTEYTLEDLLRSPRPNSSAPGASTPMINNILFGEKLDFGLNDNISTHITKFDNVEGDMSFFEEFFRDSDIEQSSKKSSNPKISTEGDSKDNALPDSEVEETNSNNKEREFYCYTCKKKFNSLQGLRIHAVKLHKDKRWMQIRRKTFIPATFVCDICGLTVRGHGNFGKHKKTHEPVSKLIKMYECRQCVNKFDTEKELQQHNKNLGHDEFTHQEKNYDCDICGESMVSVKNLQLHRKRHDKKFEFKCNHCLQAFLRNCDLKVHMNSHSNIKKYNCKVCGKLFKRKDGLIRHTSKCGKGHRRSSYKIECEYCGALFKEKPQLRNHMQRSSVCLNVQAKIRTEKQQIEQQEIATINYGEHMISVNGGEFRF